MIYRISPFQNETIIDILENYEATIGEKPRAPHLLRGFLDLRHQEDSLTFELSEGEALDLAADIEDTLCNLEQPYLDEAELLVQMLRRLARSEDDGLIHDLGK